MYRMPFSPLRSLLMLLMFWLAAASAQAQIKLNSTADVLRVVVQVRPTGMPGVSGSGTLISPRGYVLTNWHVLAQDPNKLDSPVSKSALIFLSDTATASPTPRYLARTEIASASLDLALLRIVSDVNGDPVTSATVFPYVAVAKRDTIQLGATVNVWGYPGIAGPTITNTVGVVSGFTGENLQSNGDRWIKTDAKIDPGNSGGAGFIGSVLAYVPTKLTFRQMGEDKTLLSQQNWGRPADLLSELKVSVPGLMMADSRGAAAGSTPTNSPPSGSASASPALPKDGVARNSEQLTALIARGGTVKVARGTYALLDPIIVNRDLVLVGDGSKSTVITSNAADFVMTGEEEINLSLEGVTVRHTETRKAEVLYFKALKSLSLKDVVINGATIEKDIKGGGSGLWVEQVGTAILENVNSSDNAYQGVLIDDARAISVKDSTFARNGTEGINGKASDTFTVQSTTFIKNGGVGLAAFGDGRLTASKLEFDGNGRGVYCEIKICSARDVQVKSNFSSDKLNLFSCRKNANCIFTAVKVRNSDINAVYCGEDSKCELDGFDGIDTASNNSTLTCADDAECNFKNIKNRALNFTLFVTGRAKAKLSEAELDDRGWPNLVKGDAQLTISNSSFRTQGIVADENAQLTLSKVVFDRSANALLAKGRSSVTLSDIDFNEPGLIKDTTCSLLFTDQSTSVLANVKIDRAVERGLCVGGTSILNGAKIIIQNSHGSGMEIYERTRVGINDLKTKSNGGTGISSDSETELNIQKLYAEDNAGSGIYSLGRLILSDSSLINNKKFGVNLETSNASVFNSLVSGNTSGGISIGKFAPSIQGCEIRNNRIGIIHSRQISVIATPAMDGSYTLSDDYLSRIGKENSFRDNQVENIYTGIYGK
ncbi:right-handed parallel beta-helix repeat-containing protein [Deinococcus sp. AJ005]|uniref:right-handed parallel beta-helix repeat-containing protein n=1 Tax=Deinococcus sp. AJ005 TaxID=2652443 RepID=UPI00125CBBF9|nr:right-handed parallel beta-helix repeat-containing protein [Deinococcus sp. AJ005]QFP76610.1 hypothetical protein DAAJ005_09185 [Deinococcus sp. AJ005]